MSWLSDMIDNVTKKEAVDFLFQQISANTTNPIVNEACYISVRVSSLRLPYTRVKVVEKIYGVVHAFAELDSRFGSAVEFTAATMPAKLAGVDPKNLQNVITIDKLVVGPTPWSEGDFNLQVGLFSVVSENLAGPFLETMTKLTEVVGVGFAAAAKPYVDTLKFGVKALTSAEGSVKLEVGVDITMHPPNAGTYALVAAPKGRLSGKTLTLNPDDRKLLVDGRDYSEKPYLVLTVEGSTQRSDWGDIPDLKASFSLINDAIRNNDQDKGKEAFENFKRLAVTSMDLLPADGDRLVAKAQTVLARAFGDDLRSSSKENSLLEFHQLGLYEPDLAAK